MSQIIKVDELLEKTKQLLNDGYRLVQIGCTKIDHIEINYSFDKNYEFLNLKLILDNDSITVPSISNIYASAFIYENEIHDLFGIKITDISIDFNGTFYKTAIKFPFANKG